MPVRPPAVDAVTAVDFRKVFRQHAAGVVVITLDGGAGPAGFTATSFVSVSLHPPLAAFAISRTSSTWPHLRTATTLVVNLVGRAGYGLADRFATSGADRFAAPTRWHRLPSGEPVLDDAQHWLRARVEEFLPVGDHHLVIVRIEQVEVGADAPGLAYHRGAYHQVGADA